VAPRFEVAAQLGVIVNFAIVVEHEAAVRGVHRLVPGRRQIDDRQPPVGEADAGVGIDPAPFVIRSAVGDHPRHPLEEVGFESTPTDQACNAAHPGADSICLPLPSNPGPL
jgi:hypothetical protein